MKNVTNVRSWLLSRLGQAFKVQLSMMNEVACVDRFKGPDGQLMVGRWVEQIMKDLGHETEASLENPDSRIRKAARKQLGVRAGQTETES